MALPALRCAMEPLDESESGPAQTTESIPTSQRLLERHWLLLFCGMGSVGLYAALTARYPLLIGLQVVRGSWVTIVGASWGALAAHITIYAALTILYTLALRSVLASTIDSRRPQIAVSIGMWLICSCVLLGAYPGGESHDVFDYLFRGRMMTEYGANPLAEIPSRFSKAPFYEYISWHSHVDTYGPLWEYASATTTMLMQVVFRAVGGIPLDRLPTCPDAPASCTLLAGLVTGYRLLAIGLTGLSGALIYRMVKRSHPAHAPAALVAWLWNPVVLIGTALGAHNDALMLTLMLAALALIQERRLIPGLLVLVLAAHVKPTALLIVPTLGIWLLRQHGWKRTVIAAFRTLALAVPISWLLYAPLGGWATIPRMLYERGLYLANAPAASLYRWLLDVQHMEMAEARMIATRAATLLFGVLALVLLQRTWRISRTNGTDALLWGEASAITLAYLLVGSFWFQHWYLLWVLILAALIPSSLMTRVLLPWYGFGALSANLAGNIVAELPALALSRLTREAIMLGVTLLPLALALLVVIVSQIARYESLDSAMNRDSDSTEKPSVL